MTDASGEAPGHGPRPHDQARYDELTTGIAGLLSGAAPRGWRRIDLRGLMTVAVSDLALTVVLEDGSTPAAELPQPVIEMAAELRSTMYRPGHGTWLSMRVLLDPPGSYWTSFNYDYDPLWDPELPDDAYAQDLAAFPRDDEHIPGWLRAHVQGGAPNGRPPNAPSASSAPLNPIEQNELLEEITLLLVHTLPPAYQECVALHRGVGSHSETLAQVRRASGPGLPSLWTPPPALGELFARLRSGMYAPDLGTWFTAKFRLTFPFRYDIQYDRDNEPNWRTPPPPTTYAEDLRAFPRTPGNTPSWLRERAGTP